LKNITANNPPIKGPIIKHKLYGKNNKKLPFSIAANNCIAKANAGLMHPFLRVNLNQPKFTFFQLGDILPIANI